MRNYELTFIVHPQVDSEGLTAVIETVKGLIERSGGEVVKVDLWGVRRLAYPIKKQWEGQYVLMRFDMATEGIAGLERSLGLVEQVIRHLIVRLEEAEVGKAADVEMPELEEFELPEPDADDDEGSGL